MTVAAVDRRPANSPRRVLAASLIGTTIQFYDFYIYASAAVLVFAALFFPDISPGAALLQSLATLVAALLTMGVSTVAMGLLPTHARAGLLAPLLLAPCRFGRGLGMGGSGAGRRCCSWLAT